MSLPEALITATPEGPKIKEAELKKIVEMIMAQPTKLGCGRNACVFTLGDVGICVKQNRTELAVGDEPAPNAIWQEMRYQEQAIKAGVRSPEPLYNFTDDDGRDHLLMETIDGKSLKDILADRLDLPERYNHQQFWSRLRAMIKKLHQENLYHRDLHEGNVMIEWSSGEPVIIDWGHARTSFSHDDDPYRQEWLGRTTDLLNDDKQVKEMEKRLANYELTKK